MKKTLLILTSMLILSCVSLPNPQESNTGMVAFIHQLDNKADIEIFGQYRITIKGMDSDYETKLRLPKNTGVTKFYLKPGNYKISKIEFIYDHNNSINNMSTSNRDLAILKVEEGKIIIVKTVLSTETSIDGDYHVMTRNLKRATDEDIEKTKKKIMAVDGSDMWEFK